MLRFGRIGLVLLLAATLASGREPASLENAAHARALLGPGAWTRLIRVENTNPDSRYPREVFALVFEFDGILWFYTDTDGTQSFSLHRHNLAAEEADFGPLLRDIEPGFGQYEVVAEPPVPAAAAEPLPNGCFIESYAALRERERRGERVRRADLLSYYADVGGRWRGHTVLAYETRTGAYVIDPTNEPGPRWMGRTLPAGALTLARALRPDLSVAKACWTPAPASWASTALLAALSPRRERGGKEAILQ